MVRDELERIRIQLEFLLSDIGFARPRMDGDSRQFAVQAENHIEDAIDSVVEAIAVCEREGL